MFLLTEPSDDTITNFIKAQRELAFSYQAVGATNGNAPTGYVIDHNRVQIGTGAAVFQRAKDALGAWRQFDLGWVSIVPPGVPVTAGATVAVKAHTFGAWSLSATRVVYVINEAGPMERFGFAYGTLPDHVETGEERFKVEWDLNDDTVWYDILAFSSPHHQLVKMAAPLARQLQKRFARESMRRMVELTSGAR
jgi:uncharacterized protein (UPF0548 family)